LNEESTRHYVAAQPTADATSEQPQKQEEAVPSPAERERLKGLDDWIRAQVLTYEAQHPGTLSVRSVAVLFSKVAERKGSPWMPRSRIVSFLRRSLNGTVYDYNLVVSSLHQLGHVVLCFDVFDMMKRELVDPNLITFHSVINCYLAKKQLDVALQVLDDIPKYDLTPDIVTYATVIKGAAESDKLNEVPRIIKHMQKYNTLPEFVSAVSQYANDKEGLLKVAEEYTHKGLTQQQDQVRSARA